MRYAVCLDGEMGRWGGVRVRVWDCALKVLWDVLGVRDMEPVLSYRYQPAAHLRVTDEDAADFLQSQFSNELRPFEAGRCVYGLWLDVKGKVIADSTVLCEGDEAFRIISEHCTAETIQTQLEQHIIADEVIIEPEAALVSFALIGEVPEGFWKDLGLVQPSVSGFSSSKDLIAYRGRRAQGPSFEVHCLNQGAVERLEKLQGELGFESATEEAVESLRLAAGVPRIPNEIGPGDLPGEGGLIEKGALSLNKGCYLGQEVVARMHNLGRPQRGLFIVEGSGDVDPSAMITNTDGKNVGELRTRLPEVGNVWRGVALLKVRFANVGDELELSGSKLTVKATL